MAEITWTEEAQRWLEDIFESIAADNRSAAARTVQGIYERTQDLATFPEMGYRYLASSRHVEDGTKTGRSRLISFGGE